MTAEISEITAGEYELVSEIFDKQTSKPGEPFTFERYRKGDRVTLDEHDARRLYAGGGIVRVGEREQQALALARAQYEAALAALPDEIRAQVLGNAPAAADDGTDPVDPVDPVNPAGTGSGAAPQKPKRTASQEAWAAYAVSQGANEAEVSSTSREDLIAKYGA